ncbi:MAG: nuclease-related domain-containing protein, partial [Acidimicrobiales bacterium]
DPSAGASAADHHRALLGPQSQDGGDEVPLVDLLGPLTPIESVPAAKWRRGAEGERRTAQLLAPLRNLGWTVLHDRRIPGSTANVDHLVVGPSGIWVVDSKFWQGRVKVLGDGRLWYGRRCLDDDLRVLRWITGEVARVVGGQGNAGAPLPVHSVLCVHGARLPRAQLFFNGVTLSAPEALRDLLKSGTPCLTGCEVERLAAKAAKCLPAKTRASSWKEID